MLDQKSRRIQELKSLLVQARGKLQIQREEIQSKDTTISELRSALQSIQRQQLKTTTIDKDLNSQMTELETRIAKSSQMVGQRQGTIKSLQKQNIILAANNKNISMSVEAMIKGIKKHYVLESEDEGHPWSDYQKVGEELAGSLTLDKSVDELRVLIIGILNNVGCLVSKSSESSIVAEKRQLSLKRSIENLESEILLKDKSISIYQQQINTKTLQHQKQLSSLASQYQTKVSKEQLNVQYLKNIFLKLFDTVDGPCIKMSLKVIQSLLSLNDTEVQVVEKHFKL